MQPLARGFVTEQPRAGGDVQRSRNELREQKLLVTRGATALGLTTAGGQAGRGEHPHGPEWGQTLPPGCRTEVGKKKLLKLLSFPVGAAAGPGPGNPPLMQADLSGDPGKSRVPEAASLKQALVKRGCCSSTARRGGALRRRSPGRPQGTGRAEPGASVLEERGMGRVGAGGAAPLSLPSPEPQTRARAGCPAGTRQTPPPVWHAWPRLWRAAPQPPSALGPQAGGQGHGTQPGSTSGAGRLPGRGKLPGEEPRPTGPQTTSTGCDPPLSAGPAPGPGQNHFAQEEAARSRGERSRANWPLPPPRCQRLAARHRRLPGSCCVRRGSSQTLPSTTHISAGLLRNSLQDTRTSTTEPEPLP